VLILTSCVSRKESTIDLVSYQNEVNTWHAQRVKNDLKGKNGWLNLAGLFWLNEGFNTFGSATTNDIVFPEGKMEANAGTFIVQQGTVTMEVAKGVKITVDSMEAASNVIHIPDSAFYPVSSYGTLRWVIIDR
jgi:hypothetical protein